MSRHGAATLVAPLAVALLTAGCGGSLADADSAGPRTTTRAAAPDPFCAAVEANSAAARPLQGLGDRRPDPAELAAADEELRRTGAEVLASAPNEIRTSVQEVLAVANLQLQVLRTVGGDSAAAARDPALSQRLRSPAYTSAVERVQEYLRTNCDPQR